MAFKLLTTDITLMYPIQSKGNIKGNYSIADLIPR